MELSQKQKLKLLETTTSSRRSNGGQTSSVTFDIVVTVAIRQLELKRALSCSLAIALNYKMQMQPVC